MPKQETVESLSFLDAMQDVTPLSDVDKVHINNTQQTLAKKLKRQALEAQQQRDNNYLSTEHADPLSPYDHLEYKKSGVQEGVFKRLRLGKYPIDLVVNLQGRKFEQARHALYYDITQAKLKNQRTLLIKHGIGLNSKPFPAFLKSYLNKWLRQMPEVLAFHTAQTHHGGYGATYVLVKKSEVDKQQNKERHRKR